MQKLHNIFSLVSWLFPVAIGIILWVFIILKQFWIKDHVKWNHIIGCPRHGKSTSLSLHWGNYLIGWCGLLAVFFQGRGVLSSTVIWHEKIKLQPQIQGASSKPKLLTHLTGLSQITWKQEKPCVLPVDPGRNGEIKMHSFSHHALWTRLPNFPLVLLAVLVSIWSAAIIRWCELALHPENLQLPISAFVKRTGVLGVFFLASWQP